MLDIYLFTITDIHILLVLHKMSFPSSFSDQERSIPSPHWPNHIHVYPE